MLSSTKPSEVEGDMGIDRCRDIGSGVLTREVIFLYLSFCG